MLETFAKVALSYMSQALERMRFLIGIQTAHILFTKSLQAEIYMWVLSTVHLS